MDIFVFAKRVGGIEPPSTGWKPVVIAIIRYPQMNTVYQNKHRVTMDQLLDKIAFFLYIA